MPEEAIRELTYEEMLFPHLSDRTMYERVYNDIYTNPMFHDLPVRGWMRDFHPRPCSLILELGAGTGVNLIHWAKLGHTCDGVEIAQTAVDHHHKNIKREPHHVQDRVTLAQGWAEDYEPSRLYDYVLCCEVLEHVIEPVDIMRTIVKALKEDGEAYITAPSFRRPLGQRHVRAVSGAMMAAWCDAVGLQITWCDERAQRVSCKAAKITEGAWHKKRKLPA